MDKYEFSLKVEQIKKLAAKKAYKEAADIAKEMNWQKIKDWSILAMIINIQEAAGDILEARDMAILAYNRNLGGRKLVYKLTELLIKLEDFENAEELYEEYEKMAQHDVNRFILYYELRKAENASDNELVEILEDYKEHEVDEKYMLELAKLYSNTGRKDECVKTCDDLAMWFQDGDYVVSAINLKKSIGANLTKSQVKILEDAKNNQHNDEKVKEELFKKQQELARIQQDDVEEELRRDELGDEYEEEGGIKGFFKKAFGFKSGAEVDSDEADEYSDYQEDSADENDYDDKAEDYSDDDSTDAIEEEEETGDQTGREELTGFEKPVSETVELSRASLSLKELIASAKKQIEDNCDQMNKDMEAIEKEEVAHAAQAAFIPSEDETKSQLADASMDDVRVPQYSGNVYDTQNIQAEIAKNLNMLLEEDEAEIEALRPQPVVQGTEEEEAVVDEQIEGQLSLADWVETVREEKYGHQNTREFSKAELERMLDEKDEKSAAYEKLLEEQRAKAKAEGTEFDEAEARYNARMTMMVNAAKTDLAIRTGKATARLEEAARVNKAAALAELERAAELKAAQARAELEKLEIEKERLAKEAARAKAASAREAIAKKKSETDNSAGTNVDNTAAQEVSAGTQDTVDSTPRMSDKFTDSIRSEETVINDIDELDEEVDDDRKLTGDLAKIFRKYREMPGLESQLVTYFEELEKEIQMSTSSIGNIIISGNSSSDKTDLARTIVRAINHMYPDNQKKIAKTTGDSINHRGLAKAMGKLKGTALIVESAGSIQPKRVAEIMECLEQDTDRMIVIFEDSDAEINVLLNFNPDIVNKFNHRIVLKQYTVNELVEMARRFARKRQYEVDDDALLELYLKIDKLHSNNDNIKIDDIKQVINDAIESSERRAAKKFFGGLKKKRGNSGDIIFLSEADFK